jgi:hypothetical protein
MIPCVGSSVSAWGRALSRLALEQLSIWRPIWMPFELSATSNSLMSISNQNTLAYLTSLCRDGFWGSVNLKFQHGEVIQFVKEEGIKPANLLPNTGKPNVNLNNH